MPRALTVAAFPLLLLLLCVVVPESFARPTYPAVWSGLYPESSSLQNVSDGTGTACQLCHANTSGGQPWNAYGWEIRNEFFGGAPTIADAMVNVEGLNSDGNPGGHSNLAEVNASTQPGWTTGPNNTHFFATGATITGQSPPAAILGGIDPASAVPGLGFLGALALATGTALSGALLARKHPAT